ncbi:MAG: immunity repressor protein [Clostridia bacterium]|nr:immunity repressor protein [Clostridia bacterium]
MGLNSNKDIINLGQLVSELRKKMGCSQRKFAEISGLSNATISRIENGETHSPDIETLKLLAAHLNYPLDELIKLMEQSLERNKSKGQAKLIFLLTPTRGIKRYSSVCTSIIEKEEEQLKEQTLEQAPDQETHKDISLKGMRLITLRLEKNITQKELAEASATKKQKTFLGIQQEISYCKRKV